MTLTHVSRLIALSLRADPDHRMVTTHGWSTALAIVAAYRDQIRTRLGEDAVVDHRSGLEWVIVARADDPGIRGLVGEIGSWVGATVFDDAGRKNFLDLRAGVAPGPELPASAVPDVDALIQIADAALCSALVHHRFSMTADEGFVLRAHHLLDTAAQLLISDPTDFVMYYQPIHDLRSGTVGGFEALMRWNSPAGLKTPGDFLDLVEETTLIRTVGRDGIASALGRLPDDIEGVAGPAGFISVNLARAQLVDPETIAVFRRFADVGLDMSRVWVELREDVVISIDSPASRVIELLHTMGCQIAIDDLGAGYSALSYVKDLPVSVCKVDTTLIHGIMDNEATLAVVQSISDLAQRMGIRTVAEGIECSSILPLLEELDFDYAQGYFFGHPEPPELAFTVAETCPMGTIAPAVSD